MANRELWSPYGVGQSTKEVLGRMATPVVAGGELYASGAAGVGRALRDFGRGLVGAPSTPRVEEKPAARSSTTYTPSAADLGIHLPAPPAKASPVQFRTDRQFPAADAPQFLGSISSSSTSTDPLTGKPTRSGNHEYYRQGDTLMVKGDDGQLRASKWAQSLKPPTLSQKAKDMGAVSDFWANMGLKGPDEYVATRSKQEGDVYKARLEAEAAKNQLAMQERLRTDALEKAHLEHQDRVSLKEAMVGARQAEDAAKAETEARDAMDKNTAKYADRLKGLGWNDKQVEAFRLASPQMAPSIARAVGRQYGDLTEQDLAYLSPYLKQNINDYILKKEGTLHPEWNEGVGEGWWNDVLTIGDSSLPVSDFAASAPALTARQLQSSKLKPEERAAIGG